MLTPRQATQAEVDHLVGMIASGTLASSFNGKSMTFGSFEEIRDRINFLVRASATTAEVPAIVLLRRRAES